MEQIDITAKLEDFYRHLSEPDVDRTIFSAKFGDGKTVFLNQFREKYSDKYDFYTLYPVNYQIAPNEQVMEYIKRDILFQVLVDGKIKPDIEIPYSILLPWYLSRHADGLLAELMSFVPSLVTGESSLKTALTAAIGLTKQIKEQYNKFKKSAKKMCEDDFIHAAQYIADNSNAKGNIYELDLITYLIAKTITQSNKPSVLIIEDLDRIDPAHLFRILNVFSAHIDRHYQCSNLVIKDGEALTQLDQLHNKFGFDKVVFVMDANATEAIFKHFYGNSNYKGYISKFLSHAIFRYSINDYAQHLFKQHIINTCECDFSIIVDNADVLGVYVEKLSVRDFAKILDNFSYAYDTKEIEVTDGFRYLSDTPLVKLLATLRRMGVQDINILSLFLKHISTPELLLQLLGCFAMNIETIGQNCTIYYDDKLYQYSFEDRNGYKTCSNVLRIKDITSSLYKSLRIDIDKCITNALQYVK